MKFVLVCQESTVELLFTIYCMMCSMHVCFKSVKAFSLYMTVLCVWCHVYHNKYESVSCFHSFISCKQMTQDDLRETQQSQSSDSQKETHWRWMNNEVRSLTAFNMPGSPFSLSFSDSKCWAIWVAACQYWETELNNGTHVNINLDSQSPWAHVHWKCKGPDVPKRQGKTAITTEPTTVHTS